MVVIVTKGRVKNILWIGGGGLSNVDKRWERGGVTSHVDKKNPYFYCEY